MNIPPYSTKDDLIAIIQSSNKVGDVKAAIKHSNSDGYVLSEAIRKCDYISDKASVNEILECVIGSSKVTPNILADVIQTSKIYARTVIAAINSQKADESVLKTAITKCDKILDRNSVNDILKCVIGSLKVTPNILADVIKTSKIYASTVIAAINSPKADESVLKAAIRKCDDISYRDSVNEILKLVIGSSKVTPNILADVIQTSKIYASTVIAAINSPKADESVLKNGNNKMR